MTKNCSAGTSVSCSIPSPLSLRTMAKVTPP
jgi:hypothetical protein